MLECVRMETPLKISYSALIERMEKACGFKSLRDKISLRRSEDVSRFLKIKEKVEKKSRRAKIIIG